MASIVTQIGNTGVTVAELNGNVVNGNVVNQNFNNLNNLIAQTARHAAAHSHHSIKNRKTKGTCNWLLDRRDYQDCVHQRGESGASALWIHGPPGCGKSTLMSSVVDELLAKQNTKSAYVMYHYIDFKKNADIWTEMILTFWDQVAAESGELGQRFFASHDSPDEIRQDLIRLLVSRHRPAVYMVVDALDKPPKAHKSSDQAPEDVQATIIEELNRLCQDLNSQKPGTSLVTIVSSRDPAAPVPFNAKRKFQIKVTPQDTAQDIDRYLEAKINARLLSNHPIDAAEKEALVEKVCERLKKYANGMFVWVDLQASNFCTMGTPRTIEDNLEKLALPRRIEVLYSEYASEFEEIRDTLEGQLALRTLSLLAHKRGWFPLNDLLVAIELTADGYCPSADVKSNMRSQPMMIVQYCKFLVEVDDELGIVRFFHKSTYDFFNTYRPERRHALIAELSLSCLRSAAFPARSPSPRRWYERETLQQHLREHPLLAFACRNWVVCVKKSASHAPRHLIDLFWDLCKRRDGQQQQRIPGGKVVRYYEEDKIGFSFQLYQFSRGKPLVPGICWDHVVSFFGLTMFLEQLKDKVDGGRCDGGRLTPMHWAIKSPTKSAPRAAQTTDKDGSRGPQPAPSTGSGASETCRVVETLVGCGGDINARDSKDRTPLYYAAWFGKSDVVELLLSSKAKVDVSSDECGTALRVASSRDHGPSYPDHLRVTEALLRSGADPNAKSECGSPLHAVAWVGCLACAELMFDRKISRRQPRRNVVGGHFGTALHAAAFNGNDSIVQLLLAKRFDVNKVHHTYGTALTAAASGCWGEHNQPREYVNVFRLLIGAGAKVNIVGGLHVTALHAAASFGHQDLVTILLENDADVLVAGPWGTAYEAASNAGQEHVTALFKKMRPQVRFDGHQGVDEASASAASSRDKDTYRPHIWLWDILLRIALATRDAKVIERRIEFAEVAFKRAIDGRHERILGLLARAGEDVFEVVVTWADTEGGGVLSKEQRSSLAWLRKALRTTTWKALFCCCLLRPRPLPPRGPDGHADALGPGLSRQLTPTELDVVNQVLDLLTQVAVRILEAAFATNDPKSIEILSRSWTRALERVRSKGRWGESMMDVLLKNRADQLRAIMADDEDADDDADDAGASSLQRRARRVEKFHDARRLAEVGVELLVTALKQRPENKELATGLGELWVGAVEQLEELGHEHEQDIDRLIAVFAQRFDAEVRQGRRDNVKGLADAGVEILQTTFLRKRRNIAVILGNVMADKWTVALSGNMEPCIDELLTERRLAYQDSIRNGRHGEALAWANTIIQLTSSAFAKARSARANGRHDDSVMYARVAETLFETIGEEVPWTLGWLVETPSALSSSGASPTKTSSSPPSSSPSPSSSSPDQARPISPQRGPRDPLTFADTLGGLIVVADEADCPEILDPLLKTTMGVLLTLMSKFDQGALEEPLVERVQRATSVMRKPNLGDFSKAMAPDVQQLRQDCRVVSCLLRYARKAPAEHAQPLRLLTSVGAMLLAAMEGHPRYDGVQAAINELDNLLVDDERRTREAVRLG